MARKNGTLRVALSSGFRSIRKLSFRRKSEGLKKGNDQKGPKAALAIPGVERVDTQSTRSDSAFSPVSLDLHIAYSFDEQDAMFEESMNTKPIDYESPDLESPAINASMNESDMQRLRMVTDQFYGKPTDALEETTSLVANAVAFSSESPAPEQLDLASNTSVTDTSIFEDTEWASPTRPQSTEKSVSFALHDEIREIPLRLEIIPLGIRDATSSEGLDSPISVDSLEEILGCYEGAQKGVWRRNVSQVVSGGEEFTISFTPSEDLEDAEDEMTIHFTPSQEDDEEFEDCEMAFLKGAEAASCPQSAMSQRICRFLSRLLALGIMTVLLANNSPSFQRKLVKMEQMQRHRARQPTKHTSNPEFLSTNHNQMGVWLQNY